MACYKPLSAWRSINTKQNGKHIISFKNPGDLHMYTNISLPCNQCIGCRLERAKQWALRCSHEASEHKQNTFITLTYNPEHYPQDGSLVKDHFVKFMKRLRFHLGKKKIKFYMCGEYGDQLGRPHYHSIIFGHEFPDKKIKSERNGKVSYTSETLTKLWGKGFCQIDEVNYQTCNYVARYIMKKINGDHADEYYQSVDDQTGEIHQIEPEYNNMSRMPGIGKKWFDKYKYEIYTHDNLYSNGHVVKPPRYYDGQMEKEMPGLIKDIKKDREIQAKKYKKDNTPDRLKVREKCANAKLKTILIRNMQSC